MMNADKLKLNEPRVLLLQLPWSSAETANPLYGFSHALLDAAGIGCETYHGNVLAYGLAEGEQRYHHLRELSSRICKVELQTAGDDDGSYRLDVIFEIGITEKPEQWIDLIEETRRCVESIFREVAWDRFGVIGVSISQPDLLAFLMFACLLEERHTDKRIVLHADNLDSDMAVTLKNNFRQIVSLINGGCTELARTLIENSTAVTLQATQPTAKAVYSREGITGEPLQFGQPDMKDSRLPNYESYVEQIQKLNLRHLKWALPSASLTKALEEEINTSAAYSVEEMFRPESEMHVGEFAELLEVANKYRCSRFNLGMIDFGDSNTTATLNILAQLRREHMYGISLLCQVPLTVSKSQISLLHNAGVEHVELAEDCFMRELRQTVGVVRANLWQVKIVRQLHEHEIDVTWRLLCPGGDDTSEAYREIIAMLPSLYHIPPPIGLLSGSRPMLVPFFKQIYPPDSNGRLNLHLRYLTCEGSLCEELEMYQQLADAVTKWQQFYRPRLLTYGHGPGFVRIFDRRQGYEQAEFITIRGRQVDVLFFIEECRSFVEVSDLVSDVSKEQLRSFLNRLVERKLAMQTTDDSYQMLPVRRRREEKWSDVEV